MFIAARGVAYHNFLDYRLDSTFDIGIFFIAEVVGKFALYRVAVDLGAFAVEANTYVTKKASYFYLNNRRRVG